jgi:hypothetical protein
MKFTIDLNSVGKRIFQENNDLKSKLSMSPNDLDNLEKNDYNDIITLTNQIINDKLPWNEKRQNIIDVLKSAFEICYINNINLQDFIQITIDGDKITVNEEA